MKLLNFIAAIALFDATVSAAAIPDVSDLRSIQEPAQERQDHQRDDSPAYSFFSDLWKRRGGGASGGRGGGSSSSSSGSSSSGSSSGSSGSSSGSSSSGKSGSSSSSTGKTGSSSSSSGGRGSSTSSTGGKTSTGSGVTPSYGGGRYYGGGTTVPYRSGSRSTGGIVPGLFIGSAIAFWPGLWYHPVYLYPYTNNWSYLNRTSNQNETKPVNCGCDAYQECGCDDNSNQTYIDSVIGNGSYSALNKTLITLGDVNGTETILINGTLPNGTTASGGTESASAAGAGLRELAQFAGWWPLAATAVAMVFFV